MDETGRYHRRRLFYAGDGGNAEDAENKGAAVQLVQGDIGLIEQLGKVLFTDYVVPFEISSVLFLSAMVGTVVIGKRMINQFENLKMRQFEKCLVNRFSGYKIIGLKI